MINTEALILCAKDMGYEAVVFSFDEVHGSFTRLSDVPGQYVFHCLRRALNSITNVKSLISVFLSTAGEVHHYAPPTPTDIDPSRRIQNQEFRLIPPFTDIGFDQLAVGKVEKNIHYLQDMVTVEWMCQFGRPLYVKSQPLF